MIRIRNGVADSDCTCTGGISGIFPGQRGARLEYIAGANDEVSALPHKRHYRRLTRGEGFAVEAVANPVAVAGLAAFLPSHLGPGAVGVIFGGNAGDHSNLNFEGVPPSPLKRRRFAELAIGLVGVGRQAVGGADTGALFGLRGDAFAHVIPRQRRQFFLGERRRLVPIDLLNAGVVFKPAVRDVTGGAADVDVEVIAALKRGERLRHAGRGLAELHSIGDFLAAQIETRVILEDERVREGEALGHNVGEGGDLEGELGFGGIGMGQCDATPFLNENKYRYDKP